MTAFPARQVFLVCCEDGIRTEITLRPVHFDDGEPHTVAELVVRGEGSGRTVGLSREACRVLARELTWHARRRQA